MKILFVHDTYYSQIGQDYFAYGAFPYALWQERFLPHFDSLTVVGREKEGRDHDKKLDQSAGPHVHFKLFPNINSPLKRLFGASAIYRDIEDLVRAHDGVIIRGPVELGMMAAKAARKLGKPYAVEMSGCAFDHTWYHGSLIGKLYAPVKYVRARSMLKYADFVICVTKYFLQRRYPSNAVRKDNASNVEIGVVEARVLEERLAKIQNHEGKIVFGLIGNFGNNLKGLGIALKALSQVKKTVPDFELRLLGQGDPAQWAGAIQEAGLEGQIVFCGTMPGGAPVQAWLDEIDIYIQPSFHEGLPRALIEAMSRGCPALASDAGGSDELLAQSYIHRRGNDARLADHILSIAHDKDKQMILAQDNFEKAKEYTKEVLKPRRAQFWQDYKEFIQKAGVKP